MTAQVSRYSGLAGRYASALFELADERRELDAVAADLGRLKALIADSAELREAMRSPLFARAQQTQAMAAILDQLGIGDLTRRFVLLAARNRRLFALPQVIDAFAAMLAARREEVTAVVTSAKPLSEDQVANVRAALQASVERAGGRQVALDLRVEPGLLGGLVVKVGSRLVDASLRSKLQRLQLVMKGVA